MSKWKSLKIREETYEEMQRVKEDYQKRLDNENKQRLIKPLVVSDDMTIQRLLKLWFR